jgi:hypothetical protein
MVRKLRSIAGALTIIACVFAIPVLATLIAGEVGLPHRLVGWLTLLLMGVLAYFCRPTLGRLLFGSRELPQARPRRSHKRS